MVHFIIIRHGYSAGNKEKRFTGQADVPLDEIGHAQAECTAAYVLKNFRVDSIYSSDLIRAYDTAKPLADALGLPIHQLKALREVDVGRWQGMLIEDVKKEYPEDFESYRSNPGLFSFPGGGSYLETMERARLAIESIAAENEGKTVVIATHGGVIRTLRAAWGGVAPENIKDIPHVPNASLTLADYQQGEVRLTNVGYTEHLSDRTTEVWVK